MKLPTMATTLRVYNQIGGHGKGLDFDDFHYGMQDEGEEHKSFPWEDIGRIVMDHMLKDKRYYRRMREAEGVVSFDEQSMPDDDDFYDDE